MRALRCGLLLASLLTPVVGSGQDAPRAHVRTDAETDGFAGPVKSVVTTVSRHQLSWRQPDGPGLWVPITCHECDYDPGGTKLSSGQHEYGAFHGEAISLIRDPQGRTTQRRTFDAANGDLLREETIGPFGPVERTYYQQGKITARGTFSYDDNGHLSGTFNFDGDGAQQGRTEVSTTPEGVRTSDTAYGKNGHIQWQQTFSPDTQTARFASFDDAGALKLSWTRVGDKLTSFWEASDTPNQFGDCYWGDSVDSKTQDIHCYRLGGELRHQVHYEFLDRKRALYTTAEWRDPTGKVLYAAYYEYTFDTHKNWTNRRIWVTGPDLPGRTLYEDDSRILTYWR